MKHNVRERRASVTKYLLTMIFSYLLNKDRIRLEIKSTLTPSLALDATVFLNESKASHTAISNAPAPGTTHSAKTNHG